MDDTRHGPDSTTEMFPRPGTAGQRTARNQGPETRDSEIPRSGPPGPDRFPRQHGRFRLEGLLGEGGMGRVYGAHDPQLDRRVAIKVLRARPSVDVDPIQLKRFVREARVQAALTHPNICPVYEAGELEGRPFIAMQRIDGRPLHEATRGAGLERKLILVEQVARAVHGAHRVGLVHRDLKPANVLVETNDEGELRPYVLDFGLARSVGDHGFAAAGTVAGTPAYMAPEQIEGAPGGLDRRTDVYALGATLYHLLAGHPPFTGADVETYREILRRPPPPLDPREVPTDVSAIILRCLAKDPEQRYPSARALADDLRRYLDGEPVHARTDVGWPYRIRKWIGRHRTLTVVTAAASLLLASALTWGAWTSWRSRQVEQLARRFTEQVETIEAEARYSHLAPLHDIRADREQLRRRMAELRRQMERSGNLGRAAGHYALGRGALALEEPGEALDFLRRAWDGGYRNPDAAGALALALSALYRDRLASLELSGDWDARRRRLAQLVEDFGDPALAFLGRRPPANSLKEPFLAALAAYHDGRFDDALTILRRSGARRPWSYELWRLEGDILRTRAVGRGAEGQSDSARADLELARTAYQRAADIGPSHPGIARAFVQTVVLGMTLDAFSGEPVDDVFATGLGQAQRALAIHPEDPRGWLWKARLHRVMAQRLRLDGVDPTPHLELALTAARSALPLSDSPSEAQWQIGRAHWVWARWRVDRGEDPSDHIDLATAALDRVDRARRDHAYFHVLGLAQMTLGDHRAAGGGDADPHYARAAVAYRAAAELHSSPSAALSNLGVSLFKQAHLPGHGDVRGTLREAAQAFERALEIDPSRVPPHYYLGRSHLRLARLAPAPGGADGDPSPSPRDRIEPAVRSFQAALAVAPELPPLHSALGEAHYLRALDAWDRGGDPSPHFEAAEGAFRRALELAPGHVAAQQNLAWVAYFQGKFAVRGNRDGKAHLDRALGLSREVLLTSRTPGAALCEASALRLGAEGIWRRGGDPSDPLKEARRGFEGILERNPRHGEAHRSLGRLATLEARWLLDSGRDPAGAFQRSRASLDAARRWSPEEPIVWLADARDGLERGLWHRDGGRSAEETAAVERGRVSADRALTLRPGWAEAVAVRAVLDTVMSRGADASTPCAALGRAVDANPHLRAEWGGDLDTCRRGLP
ncbi:MAG: protein kinase [Acidobacteriota bacterium]